eukprot:scaffold359333_cov14-Prasinocladus_malaysianus.AAC.1
MTACSVGAFRIQTGSTSPDSSVASNCAWQGKPWHRGTVAGQAVAPTPLRAGEGDRLSAFQQAISSARS